MPAHPPSELRVATYNRKVPEAMGILSFKRMYHTDKEEEKDDDDSATSSESSDAATVATSDFGLDLLFGVSSDVQDIIKLNTSTSWTVPTSSEGESRALVLEPKVGTSSKPTVAWFHKQRENELKQQNRELDLIETPYRPKKHSPKKSVSFLMYTTTFESRDDVPKPAKPAKQQTMARRMKRWFFNTHHGAEEISGKNKAKPRNSQQDIQERVAGTSPNPMYDEDLESTTSRMKRLTVVSGNLFVLPTCSVSIFK